MGSQYVSDSAPTDARPFAIKDLCACGKCDCEWFSQGWKCPARTANEAQRPRAPQRGTVCLTLPRNVVGSLLASRGEALKNLKEITGCTIRIDDRYDGDGAEKAMRTASISAREGTQEARDKAIAICARTLQLISEDSGNVADAVSKAMMEADEADEEKREREEQEKAKQEREQEDALVRMLALSVGDKFTEEAMRDALKKENWIVDRAADRLFNHRAAADEPVKPALNKQKLLAAIRKKKECEVAAASPKVTDRMANKPCKKVQMVRDVFAQYHAKQATKSEK